MRVQTGEPCVKVGASREGRHGRLVFRHMVVSRNGRSSASQGPTSDVVRRGIGGTLSVALVARIHAHVQLLHVAPQEFDLAVHRNPDPEAQGCSGKDGTDGAGEFRREEEEADDRIVDVELWTRREQTERISPSGPRELERDTDARRIWVVSAQRRAVDWKGRMPSDVPGMDGEQDERVEQQAEDLHLGASPVHVGCGERGLRLLSHGEGLPDTGIWVGSNIHRREDDPRSRSNELRHRCEGIRRTE